MGRTELGDFLRRRREALQPADAGLPGGGRRRTPGLRRDEVAELANMSAVYYERLEQARGPQPSATVIAGIAGALRLTSDERDHLYFLAGQAAPPGPCTEPVDPGLLYVTEAVAATTPAFVCDDLSTVLAQNALNVDLFGRFAGRPGHEANLIWAWFTSPAWRHRLRSRSAAEQEATGLSYVADLRAVIARRGHDPEATALVGALTARSPEFAEQWQNHPVSTLHCSTKIVEDGRVGRLELDCVITGSPDSRQRLLMLKPVPGTGTDERLGRLHALLN